MRSVEVSMEKRIKLLPESSQRMNAIDKDNQLRVRRACV